MGEQRNLPGIAREAAAVDEGDDPALCVPDPAAAERCVPDVEELAERVDAFDRRLRVDDAVRRVRVQPHEARRPDADSRRHLSPRAADVDRQMRVNVKEKGFRRLARDAVDPLACDDLPHGCEGLRGRGRAPVAGRCEHRRRGERSETRDEPDPFHACIRSRGAIAARNTPRKTVVITSNANVSQIASR